MSFVLFSMCVTDVKKMTRSKTSPQLRIYQHQLPKDNKFESKTDTCLTPHPSKDSSNKQKHPPSICKPSTPKVKKCSESKKGKQRTDNLVTTPAACICKDDKSKSQTPYEQITNQICSLNERISELQGMEKWIGAVRGQLRNNR